MKRLLAKLIKWAWYTVATLLLLCATLVSLGQYYFPYFGDYSDEMLVHLGPQLPFGMEIGKLRAVWTGMAPTFYVESLRLHAQDDPTLTILSTGPAEIRIDAFRSLLNFAPRVRSLTAENVQMGFVEDAGGRWRIAGVSGNRKPSHPQAILDFFLAIQEIDLRRAQMTINLRDGTRVETHDAELLLENYKNFRRLRLTVRDQPDGGTLSLLVESQGDPRQRKDFEAFAHVQMNSLRLRALQPLAGKKLVLPDLVVKGEMWGRLGRGGGASVQGNLSVPRLAFDDVPAMQRIRPAENLNLRFATDLSRNGATIWVDGISLDWYDQRLALDRVRIDVASVPQRSVKVAADYLDVGALARIVEGAAFLPGPWAKALSDLEPYGGLANATLDMQLPPQAPDFRFRARLIDVSASPWQNAPGIRNAAGYVELGPHAGHADIASGAVSLEFPRIYRGDLDFDSARGRVSWQRGPAGVRVGSELLSLQDGATTLRAGFNLQFHRDPTLDDQLSLSVGISDADVAVGKKYIPYKVSANLQKWLDASIESGTVDLGAFAYHAIFSRPGHAYSYTMQLALDAREGNVNYDPQWPPVNDVNAHVLVDGSRTQIWARSGRVLQSRIGKASVVVEPVAGKQRLQVHAELRGDTANGMQLINESPIAGLTGGLLANWKASGKMQIGLDLDMPLGERLEPGNAKLRVAADISDTTLFLGDFDLPVDDVQARFEYQLGSGLVSRAIEGKLWGKPLHAVISGDAVDPGLMHIVVDGSADMARVAEWLNLDSAGYLGGSSAFRLSIDQQRGNGFRSTLESDLVGVTSTLPVPLDKSADSAKPMQMSWQPEGAMTAIGVDYAGVLRAALNRDRAGRVSGEISLGGVPLAAGDGVRVTGEVAHTDAGAWIAATQALIGSNAQRRPDGTDLGLRFDNLRVASAELITATLSDLKLDSRWEEKDFVLSFAADFLNGEFRVPADRQNPYELHATQLQLQPFLDSNLVTSEQHDVDTSDAASIDKAVAAEVPEEVDPIAAKTDAWLKLRDVQLPRMFVRIDSLKHGAKDLGSWTFSIASATNALELGDIRAALPGLSVHGLESEAGADFRLHWEQDKPFSEFKAGLDLHDIGAFFSSWDYDRVIESRSGHAEVAFAWPGNPLDIKMVEVSGLLDFTLKDGRLTQQGSNNPLMRALGVFSFDQVLRRLKFDFKDMYQSGLGFDRFNGAIDLGRGHAVTREPVELQGPSARIRFSGQYDLRARTTDADLVVTLPIGSNLPWVAAFAGGPAAAAGVYVASKLFENQLGKFSSAVYKVSGSMDEPKLELVRVFDAGNSSKAVPEKAPAESATGTTPETTRPVEPVDADKQAQPSSDQPRDG